MRDNSSLTPKVEPVRGRWRLDWVAVVIAVAALVGLSVFLYPRAATWFSALNQSQLVRDYSVTADQATAEQNAALLAEALEYNRQMARGAVLAADSNVPSLETEGRESGRDGADTASFPEVEQNTEGPSASETNETGFLKDEGGNTSTGVCRLPAYEDLLRVEGSEVMARLIVPAASVDLPVFHGTSDETLRRGVGHLEGTALPVGGVGTRSVLTAHRGLAEATLFNELDRVRVGDEFQIEVAGERLLYRVVETQVVLPDETEQIIPSEGRDLVTLVTCTPLGLNTHRILVTGERIDGVAELSGSGVPGPGFPWWLLAFGVGLGLAGVYVWGAGCPRKRAVSPA